MVDADDPLSVFCDWSFWNASEVWDPEDLGIGMCVQRTILVWAPCLVLWLGASYSLLAQRRAPATPLPWTPLLASRLCLLLVLVMAAAAEVALTPSLVPVEGGHLPHTNIVAAVLLLASYLIAAATVVVGRRWYGQRTSGPLWVFWAMLVLCGLPQLKTTVTALLDGDDSLSPALATTFLVQYFGALLMFVLSCFADQHHRIKKMRESPQERASFFSQITFHWASRLVWVGWRRPLTHEDLWNLPRECAIDHVDRVWCAAWRKEHSALRQKTCSSKREEGGGGGGGGGGGTNPLHVSLTRVILRVHLWSFLVIFLIFFISEMLTFFTPRILGLIISFTMDQTEPAWHGYVYACTLLLVTVISSFFRQYFMYMTFKASTKVKSACMTSVYRKALTLSSVARRESTVGEIVNLMAVDSNRVSEFVEFMHVGFVAPITIAYALYELWNILGPSVLAGMAVMVLLIPINSVIANRIKRLQTKQMTHKDKRIKLASEIINGIKVLKLYAWEESFRNEMDGVRGDEVRVLRKSMYLKSTVSFIWLTTTSLVSLASFVTFVLLSTENVLDPQMAFTAIALFNLIRLPITELPTFIAQAIQASVSLGRLEKFLASPNLDPHAVCSDEKEYNAVVMHGGDFTWSSQDEVEGGEVWRLQSMELKVPRGQLVAVVGPVGAGKSSLLAAILGHMEKTSGVVVVNGDTAYSSQQAWLQNATLQQNITWGQAFDEDRYRRVVEACALKPDFDMMPAGDQTEVGEKGINMSGGQKQRVSLARAAYSSASVVLLDDPLSAVDSHVGRHIFDRLIGPAGLMKDKTRVLVTHAVWLLPQVDSIVVMEGGRVVEQGSCSRLLEDQGNFSRFLLQHASNKVEEEDDGLEELCEQLEGTAAGGQAVALLRQASKKTKDTSESPTIPDGRKRCRSHVSSSSISGQKRYEEFGGRKQLSSCSGSSARGEEGEAMMELKEKAGRTLVKEEAVSTGKVKWSVYKFYVQAAGLFSMVLPLFSYFIAQGFQAGSNLWLSIWSSTAPPNPDNATTNATDASEDFDRIKFVVGFAGFGVGQSVFFYISTVLLWIGCLRAGLKLHDRLLGSVLHLPTGFFDTNPSGRIMTRLSKEMDALDTLFPQLLVDVMACFTRVVMTLVVVVASTPIVGLVILPMAVVYLLVLVVFVASRRQIKRIESLANSPIFTFFAETIQGVSTIRAFRRQEAFIKDYQGKVHFALQALHAIKITQRWLGVRLEFIGNAISFLAALFGVLGRNVISPGIVGLSITYSVHLPFILSHLVQVSSDIEANIVSVERIKEYIEEEEEAPWRVEGAVPKSWPQEGAINFSDYKTRYRPGLEMVLRGITCSINPGEKVGIVGRTGAGKSSLVLALFRIMEAAGGTITVDGKDISRLGLHDLRSNITIIPQDPVLFSGSLRFNLDPSGAHADSAVWHALELAHLSAMVRAQPLGLQMIVEEGGSNLSIGQRQLVSLARALLRKSRILVLDEATAAVDLETDDLVQATIRAEFSHCTILTIAHRLNTIMDSDRVMVLDQGKIAEFNTPSALLIQKDSTFYSMAKAAGLA